MTPPTLQHTVKTTTAVSASLLFISLTAFTVSWAGDLLITTGIPLYLLLCVAGLLFQTLSSLRRPQKTKITSIEICFALLIIWSALSAIWSDHTETSIQQSYYYIIALLIYILSSRSCFLPQHWTIVGISFSAGCLVAAALIIAGWRNISNLDAERLSIGQLNANYVAYTLSSCLSVLIAITLRHKPSGPKKILFFLVLMTFSTAIFFTGSRGAMISAIPALGIAYYYNASRNILFIVIGTAFFGLAFPYFYEQLPDLLKMRLNIPAMISGDIFEGNWSSGRQDIWPIAFSLIEENPILGIGIGSFKEVNGYNMGAHNALLSTLIETGLIGLLIYTTLMSLIFIKITNKSLPKETRISGIALFLAWLPISLTGVWESAPVAWIVFGWFIAGTNHRPPPHEQKNIKP